MQDQWLAHLPTENSLLECISKSGFHPAPTGSALVITDVKGSTDAFKAGRSREVNMAGASTLIATINALNDSDIPFVFGGDGITALVCLKSQSLEKLKEELGRTLTRVQEAYGFNMRAAIYTIEDIRKFGGEVCIARYLSREKGAPTVTSWALSGSGLVLAEQWLKQPGKGPASAEVSPVKGPPNLEGLECRWNPLRAQKGQFITLIASVPGEDSKLRAEVLVNC